MYKLESKMLSEYHLIWLHGQERLTEFFTYVNFYHPTIKFTWKWSNKKLPFLDVMVRLKNNKLSTDIYSKPTDTHQYLNYTSCHPSHVKRGIPYGQALKLG